MKVPFRPMILVIVCAFQFSCKKGFDATHFSAEELGRYIAARVPSVIGPEDPVRIRFSVPVDTTQTSQVFTFSPATEGRTYWEDELTLAFTPTTAWKPAASYQLQIALSKIIPDVDPSMKRVVVDFTVRPVRMTVAFDPLVPEFNGESTTYLLRGRINTSMQIDSQQIRKLFSIKTSGKTGAPAWHHHTSGMSHDFIWNGIPAGTRFDFKWDGTGIGAETSGSKTIQVPKGDELTVLTFEPGSDGGRKVDIHFSQKLNATEDLNGLVSINGSHQGFTFRKQDHILSLYPGDGLTGDLAIQLHEKISSSRGHELGSMMTLELSLDNATPGLKLVGSGVITPGDADIIFPFEAINLKNVQVEVVRIFENNILQYLQRNELGDKWGLEPVGRIILQKEVDLQQLADRDNRYVWTRYALDLGPLIKLAPGSIYQIRIGFKGADTYLDCYRDAVREKQPSAYGETSSFWEYTYYYEGFNWNHTDDPCYSAFYTPDRFISRNVLASDIGLTAKQNDEGKLWVYAASIGDVQPLSGIGIEVYDFQQQLLGKNNSSGDGMATFDLTRKAFFVVASSGQQRGYLRMADGLSLSLSEFNAGGTGYQQGLRGYLYAERDVWRPGDSVHLNFILWDPEGKVDNRHPVRLTVTNPLGQKEIDITSPMAVGGIYDLAFATATTDPTGNWMAKVTVGDAVFSRSVKIETIKPNRLKIDAKVPDAIIAATGGQIIELESSWLFGAPASQLKAVVEAQFSPQNFSPTGFKEFRFTDPARKTPSSVLTIYDGKLDADGKAKVILPEIRDYLPEGQLSVSLKTRVFEAGGDFSSDRHSTTFHPYGHYAGVSIPANRWGYEQLKMNEPNTVRLASVDTDGKGAGGRQLSVGIYNAQWRWWWDRSDEDITRYNSELHVGAISTDTVVTGRDGTASYSIRPNNYGSYLIRVCDTQSGHCTGQFYYAGSWGDPTDDSDAANRLTFTTDKARYEVGDKIKLTVPSAPGSKLLLTLEKNNKVVSSKWYPATGEQTQITLDATAEMMPNVYAFVSHIQPFDHSANDMPLRMYGVLPIMVADPKTMLHPEINVPDVLAPDKSFTVTVSETHKQPMAYTIAVVDEGLLGLTRFASPDPWSHFHRQEALTLQSWDMYDDVLGGYGGAIDRLLSLGGDGSGALVDAPQAERFKPVVMHLGPFYLDAGQKKTHTLQMPNYVGAVRTMVVASDRRRWGSVSKTSTVKSDLMIQPTLPRMVSPGETIALPVQVYAMSDGVKTVNVRVSPNDMASVDGSGSQSLTFNRQGDQLVYFSLKIPERPGLLKVDITAQAGSFSASQSLELDVRIPNPPLTEVLATTLSPGQSWTGKIPVPGMKGTNTASVELSQMPPINLQRRLQFLIQYPFGCLEQTLSSAFPQLYLAALTDLSAQQEQDVRRNVQSGIARLKAFSLPSGGFTYWPGENMRDSWSNSYAGHFLIAASRAGYAVDRTMLDAWRSAQKKDAQSYRPGQYYRDDLNQAYRLYTLALDGQPLWGMMNRLRTQTQLDQAASWLLAAAYALGNRADAAKEIIQKLSTEVKPYQEMSYTYGSEIRDKALILETFLAMGMQSEAMTIARSLAGSLSGDNWYSTQSTSFALTALGKMAGQFSGKEIKATIAQNGNTETVSSTKGLVLRSLQTDGENLTLQNMSADPLFIRVTGTGRPLKGVSTEVKNNLSLKVSYRDLSGKDISPERLRQGQDFVVQITVTNPGTFTSRLDQLALAYMFPSGWELTNQRLDQFEGRFKNSQARYQDIRDDRVNTFFSMDRGTWTWHFVMTAAYAGRYWLPDIMCEAMYSHQVQARIPGRWVEVVPVREKEEEF